MLKQIFFALMVCSVSLSISSCAGAGGVSNDKIRYKVTVTVETPEGIKTGSAVREASRYTEPSILPDQGGSFYRVTSGEAVIIDLGAHGVLFSLLGAEDEAKLVFKLLLNKPAGAVDLVSNNAPLWLFYFKDMRDPLSIKPARDIVKCSPDITECAKGQATRPLMTLHDAFGSGVVLKSFEIERTSLLARKEIGNWLPWVDKLNGGYISGKVGSRGSPYGLHAGHFKIGK